MIGVHKFLPLIASYVRMFARISSVPTYFSSRRLDDTFTDARDIQKRDTSDGRSSSNAEEGDSDLETACSVSAPTLTERIYASMERTTYRSGKKTQCHSKKIRKAPGASDMETN